jgi:uncharacterized protein YbbK (DUF523 family)
MEKILVSACLLGKRTRYDGGDQRVHSSILEAWEKEGRLLPFCPEVAGGLTIPRPPAEILGGDGYAVLSGETRVISVDGRDLTAEFIAGAQLALSLCHENDIRVAILAESSPSCGVNSSYDGTFSSTKIPGLGVTTALLRQNGIRVYSQFQISDIGDLLDGRRTC